MKNGERQLTALPVKHPKDIPSSSEECCQMKGAYSAVAPFNHFRINNPVSNLAYVILLLEGGNFLLFRKLMHKKSLTTTSSVI